MSNPETKLPWYQFRLRSVLLLILAVQLALVVGQPLARWYLRYREKRRLDAIAATIQADLGPLCGSLDQTGWASQTYQGVIPGEKPSP